jgi:rhamnogalacturonyl hydrolase YesR
VIERSADTRTIASRAAEKLDHWITKNGWAGFDPHDIKGTRLFMYLLRPHPGLMTRLVRKPLLYFELFFPRAARRLFRVPPTVNAKGMALLARAYLQLYQDSGDQAHREKATYCLDWLLEHASDGYDEPCWGYPFDWQSGVVTPAGTPACVVTSAAGDAFWTAWKTLGETRYLDVCQGICRFSLKYLKQDRMSDGTICFSYTPIDDFHVHNANLLVAEFLVRVGKEVGSAEWLDIGIRAAMYALKEQNDDGSIFNWGRVQNHYNPDTIDHYHSGFEIRCLYGIWKLTGRADFKRATERYYEFYLKNLVARQGESVAPKMTPKSFYPVNVHSCAEALLLNATLAPEFAEARALVKPLLQWIVPTMQQNDGSFLYMISRILLWEKRSTIPYMRWGQAWMMLALSHCVRLERGVGGPC